PITDDTPMDKPEVSIRHFPSCPEEKTAGRQQTEYPPVNPSSMNDERGKCVFIPTCPLDTTGGSV
ncbi:MAG: hypothetical protein LBJ01_03115, partial [Tannerella sp.]|nr:hypothetical protein [Tannerella sp.]